MSLICSFTAVRQREPLDRCEGRGQIREGRECAESVEVVEAVEAAAVPIFSLDWDLIRKAGQRQGDYGEIMGENRRFSPLAVVCGACRIAGQADRT
ncbi:hypothetical protein NDS46_21065 [Paenibacillus thiaminolyticus]|uniref:hypothetical protein n=1 Tax=Paenibacillus thiaminolyticus TaxID=49283 RepID=UPI00232AAF1E|nr:hypothetical protein [Paenibacillus thiaminolyticus]WCF06816.1 hypothetical protein NDS46_21065 [Paenibacillus thiaminolyticus]WII40566.1 hypothetical protein O0V01_20945 [Paenibacillus thiaminolyticus]